MGARSILLILLGILLLFLLWSLESSMDAVMSPLSIGFFLKKVEKSGKKRHKLEQDSEIFYGVGF
jgi:hypothetical protein